MGKKLKSLLNMSKITEMTMSDAVVTGNSIYIFLLHD